MSGITASKRVKPTWATTSRSLWTSTTRSSRPTRIFGSSPSARVRAKKSSSGSSSCAASGGQASRVSISATLIGLASGSTPAAATLDVGPDVGVLERAEVTGDRRLVLTSEIDQIVEAVDGRVEDVPDLVHGLAHGLVGLGQRDDAQDLGEVGVAGRAHEQAGPLGIVAVRGLAHLLGVAAEPRALAPAAAEARGYRGAWRRRADGGRRWPRSGCRCRRGRRRCRPRRARGARGSVGPRRVHEAVPVDVADMAVATGLDEAHRDDGHLLAARGGSGCRRRGRASARAGGCGTACRPGSLWILPSTWATNHAGKAKQVTPARGEFGVAVVDRRRVHRHPLRRWGGRASWRCWPPGASRGPAGGPARSSARGRRRSRSGAAGRSWRPGRRW
jgi:hypothetical protein